MLHRNEDEMTDAEFSIVLALARCGMAHEPPTDAFLHQVRRLEKILPPADSGKVRQLLEWHDAGREPSPLRIVQSGNSP
jgi:hypothetical protein